jgi:hypothetical protein
MTHAADALTIYSTQRLKQENAELKKNQKDYLAELGELKEDFDEMKRFLVSLNKNNQKELVNQFYNLTEDKVQDEWYISDESKRWRQRQQSKSRWVLSS